MSFDSLENFLHKFIKDYQLQNFYYSKQIKSKQKKDFYDDDILMQTDGVICEISTLSINEVLGDDIKNIINLKKGITE